MATQIKVNQAYSPILERRRVKNPDPERHYRWAKGDMDRIQFLIDNYGYRIERQKGLKAGNPESLDGAITSGSSANPDILLSCPKDEWETRQRERERIARMQLEGPRETFKTEAARHGVETEDNTKSYVGTLQEGMGER